MGIVSNPIAIVHAYDVPVSYPQGVLLEPQEHVIVEEVAGKGMIFEQVVGVTMDSLGVGVVEAVQEVGRPGQIVLDRSNWSLG